MACLPYMSWRCLTIDGDIVRAQPKESCMLGHLSVRQTLDLLNSHANSTNVRQHESMLEFSFNPCALQFISINVIIFSCGPIFAFMYLLFHIHSLFMFSSIDTNPHYSTRFHSREKKTAIINSSSVFIFIKKSILPPLNYCDYNHAFRCTRIKKMMISFDVSKTEVLINRKKSHLKHRVCWPRFQIQSIKVDDHRCKWKSKLSIFARRWSISDHVSINYSVQCKSLFEMEKVFVKHFFLSPSLHPPFAGWMGGHKFVSFFCIDKVKS